MDALRSSVPWSAATILLVNFRLGHIKASFYGAHSAGPRNQKKLIALNDISGGKRSHKALPCTQQLSLQTDRTRSKPEREHRPRLVSSLPKRLGINVAGSLGLPIVASQSGSLARIWP